MDKSSPSIKATVIVPVYNGSDYLRDCLDSLAGQSYPNLEIVCVDDGSTDDSPAIIAEYAERDNRFVLLQQANGGLSCARNSGLNRATGDFVMFLDADDMLVWCAVEHLVTAAVKNSCEAVFFGAEALYDPVSLYHKYPSYLDYYRYHDVSPEPSSGPDLFVSLRKSRSFRSSACMVLINRNVLVENDIRFYDGILHEDNLFTIRTLLASSKAMVQPEPLYIRRIRENSIMTGDNSIRSAVGYLTTAVELEKLASVVENPEVAHAVTYYAERMVAHASNSVAGKPWDTRSLYEAGLGSDDAVVLALLLRVSLQAQLTEKAQASLDARDRQLALTRRHEEKARARIKALEQSYAFRIGHALTSSVAHVRRAVRHLVRPKQGLA